MKVKSKFCFFFILCIFFSCETVQQISVNNETDFFEKNPQWQEIENSTGFWQTDFLIKQRNVTYHCVKIDLQNPKLKIHIEPQKQNLGKAFNLQKISKKNNYVVSINTNPFTKKTNSLPIGILKDKNSIINYPNEKYAALCLLKNEKNEFKAKIIKNQKKSDIENFDYMIGGFFQTIENGKINKFTQTKRSRSAVGISEDGKFLYLFSATTKSNLLDQNVLTYEECSIIMQKLGCYNAMQFDGGKSTCFVINGKLKEKPFFMRKAVCFMSFYVD